MSEVYYGGTVTVKGRNLITSLVAGETIELTRIMVGKGRMPEGVEPIDMEALVDEVAEATSTVPTVEDGVLQMIVEYRNDMNGGLKEGFWLSEFGIFAKTANSEEVLLYYATLGDSPQPVNAYVDNRIDTRRYPISIALALDAEVEVSYNPGAFITAAEAQEILQRMVDEAAKKLHAAIIIKEGFAVPASGWAAVESEDGYGLQLDIEVEESVSTMFPQLALDKSSLKVAGAAGLCPTIQALTGAVRLWAKKVPSREMTGTLTLSTVTSGGGGGEYVLPTATSTTLGGVMIPTDSGLVVDVRGNLRINAATQEDVAEAYGESTPEP